MFVHLQNAIHITLYIRKRSQFECPYCNHPWGGYEYFLFSVCLHDGTLLFAVNIAPAAVRVPEAVTPQQAASGQTAILYPSAHSHALGQMVCISLLLFCLQLHS